MFFLKSTIFIKCIKFNKFSIKLQIFVLCIQADENKIVCLINVLLFKNLHLSCFPPKILYMSFHFVNGNYKNYQRIKIFQYLFFFLFKAREFPHDPASASKEDDSRRRRPLLIPRALANFGAYSTDRTTNEYKDHQIKGLPYDKIKILSGYISKVVLHVGRSLG